jgi:uncharacterized delta-60 repeat protein
MRFALRSPLALLAALILALPLLGAPSPAAAAGVEAAPGRVVFPVANGRAWLHSAVPLPGGGALLAGAVEHSGRVYLAEVSGTGALDPSFGTGGVATVDAELALEQMLVRPDGQILLVGIHSRTGAFTEELSWNEPHGSMVVIELNPDGSIDRGYGTNGTAQSTLEPGCYCHTTALEQAGGGLVLTGRQELTIHRYGGRQETHSWTLVRLTGSGVLDPGFGRAGVATVPGDDGVGLSVAESQNGTIVAQGQVYVTSKDGSSGPENVMTRLLPDGGPDGSYAGGTPFRLPVFSISDSYGQVPEPLESIVEPNGRVVIETVVRPNPGHPKVDIGIGLVAYDASGRADTTFGYGGHLDLEEGEASGSLLLGSPGGEILAVHRPVYRDPSEEQHWVPGTIAFERVSAAGLLDTSFAKPPGIAVEVPFGGGVGDPSPLSRFTYPEADSSLDQDTFLGKRTEPLLVPQADGSLLLAGNVILAAPGIPERGTDRFALAALTPSLGLNLGAGGPAHPPTLALAAPGQSAHEDVLHRRILLSVQASASGLAQIEVFSGRRLLARKLAALLDSTLTRVPVPLSASARRYLRAHSHAHLHVTATLRDLLANLATGTVGVPLR